MDYSSIIKGYTEEKKDLIVQMAKSNKADIGLHNMYNNAALGLFFRLWAEHFPNIKQEISCKGCRDSVCKFFHNIADFISSQRLESIAKLEEFNSIVKKTKNNKKSKKNV